MIHNVFHRFSVIVFTLIAAWSITGRAEIPKKIDFDASAGASIKKIALVEIRPSRSITVRNDSLAVSVGERLGGLVPAMIEGGIEGSVTYGQSKQYTELLNSKKITFVPELVAALQRELSQDGYEVVYLKTQRPTLMADKKTVDYSKIETDADAILNVYYGSVGYSSPLGKMNYAPWVIAAVKLVEAKTNNVLYFKTYNVTQIADKNTNQNVEAIVPEEKYRYGSFKELLDKFDESVEGIINCEEKIAVQVAQKLRHN